MTRVILKYRIELHLPRCQENLQARARVQGIPGREPGKKDVADSAAESVATESVAGDVGDDELAASSQSKSQKARILSNLTEQQQEDVALFLEMNDFIYHKRRTDHVFASKKNKAWEDLAREMEEVKVLTTSFESIHTQIGKLRRKKSGQAAVDMGHIPVSGAPHRTSHPPHSPELPEWRHHPPG